MKISEIINELTELQQYIGDKELEACIANDTTTGVNVMYENDDGGITSTSLEGEKMTKLIKETPSEQETLGELKVKVLDLVLCEASNDQELIARADVEVTNDASVITLNGLDLRHNDSTGIYSIVEPELPSGVCINGFTCRAITSAIAARYEQIIGKFPKRDDNEKIGNALDENMETHDMNANRLKTEERKIQWLENEIKDLEYILSSDCINRNNKLCRLQMFRELLAIKLGTCRANAVKKIKENLSRDAAEFLKDFGYLTDAEKMSIKSLTCLQLRA